MCKIVSQLYLSKRELPSIVTALQILLISEVCVLLINTRVIKPEFVCIHTRGVCFQFFKKDFT